MEPPKIVKEDIILSTQGWLTGWVNKKFFLRIELESEISINRPTVLKFLNSPEGLTKGLVCFFPIPLMAPAYLSALLSTPLVWLIPSPDFPPFF